jgi:glycosyltransferase involved in cell wall biosynthesis
MKINLVSYLDPFVYSGGGERIVRELLAEARQRGHDVKRSHLRWGKLSGVLGPRTKRHDSPDLWWLVDVWNCPEDGRCFPDALLKDALSGRYVCLENAWTTVCRRNGLPCAGEANRCPDSCDHERGRRLFANSRLSVFLSPLHRRTTERLLGLELPRVFDLPPTVDRRTFMDHGRTRDIPYLYVGTLAEYKGVLEVEARYGDQGIHWVGRNCLGRPLRGVELGPVEGGHLVALYNRTQTFVHLPRWVEPMGRTVIEALLCGCRIEVNERVGALGWGATRAELLALPDGAAVFWDRLESVAAGASASPKCGTRP